MSGTLEALFAVEEIPLLSLRPPRADGDTLNSLRIHSIKAGWLVSSNSTSSASDIILRGPKGTLVKLAYHFL